MTDKNTVTVIGPIGDHNHNRCEAILTVFKQNKVLSIFLLLQIIVIIYINLFKLDHFMGYDHSCFYLQTIEMWEQKTLYPSNWYFQSTLYWDSPVIFAVPLYGLIGNIFIAYGLANIISVGLLCLNFHLIFREMKCSARAELIFFILLFTPYLSFVTPTNNLEYFAALITVSACYSLRIWIASSAWIITWKLYTCAFSKKILIFCIGLIPLFLLSGMSSGLYILIFGLAPLIAFLFIALFYENHNIKKLIISMGYVCLLAFTVLIGKKMITALTGYQTRDTGAIWTTIVDFWDNLFSIFGGYLQLTGALPIENRVNILSIEGIGFGFRVVLSLGILVLSFLYVKKIFKNKVLTISVLLLSILITNVLVLMLTYTNYGSVVFEVRYIIPVFLVFLVMASIQLDSILTAVNSLAGNAFLFLILVCVFMNNVYSYYYFFNSQNQYDDMQSVLDNVDDIDSKVVFVLADGNSTGYMGAFARNLRVLDTTKVYKEVVNPRLNYHNWGDYLYYDENSEVVGTTVLVAEHHAYDLLPGYIKSKYNILNEIEDSNLGVYISEINPFDFASGMSKNGSSIDYMYTAGICITENGYLDDNDGCVYSNGNGGCIIYGPYAKILEGSYNIKLNYEVLSDEIGVVGLFDIAVDTETYTTAEIIAENTSVTVENVNFTEHVGKALEYRVFANPGTIIKLTSVEIEKIG